MVARANPSANRPSWVPDSSSTACARCRANFSFELRRHHCRFCGLIFCHYCSSKSRPVLALGYVEPVRVCDLCHEQCALRDAFLEVVRSGDLRSTQAMLQHQHVGSDDSTGTQTPLLVAASKGHTEVMRILLDHGANVHGLPHGEELDEEGRLPRGDSPLHYSAINGSLPCVEMLIALHADVNRRSSRYGETPLHKAVLFGRTDVALQLITAGAAMDHKNDRGISAVKLCELCGGSEMLEVFAKDFPALELVTPDYIRREFADHGAQPSDESIVKGERLLWDLVVALYLYKRPRRARALLVESLLAAYQTCLPVMKFMPQLCDLALFEPMGDAALKQLLVQISLSSCTDAMAISFFMRSAQEASPRVARNFLEVLDTLAFGTTSSSAPVALRHTNSMPVFTPADSAAAKEEHLLGEGTHEGGSKADVHAVARPRSASQSRSTPSKDTADTSNSETPPHLAHTHSMPTVGDDTPRSRRLSEETSGVAGAVSGWREVVSADGGNNGAGGASRRAMPMPGDEDDLMTMCAKHVCCWEHQDAPKDRRALLMKSRKLMRVLRELGNKLVEVNPAMRQRELMGALERVNERLPPCLYIPLLQSRYPLFYIRSILASEARVFSTNKRAPFLCVAEIDVVIRAPHPYAHSTCSGTDAAGPASRRNEGDVAADPSVGPEREVRRAQDKVKTRSFSTLADTFGYDADHKEDTSPLGPGKHLPTAAGSYSLPGAQSALLEDLYSDIALLEDMYGEPWATKKARIRLGSVHGHSESWDLIAFIVKSGDDLRQEQFAMQLVYLFQNMFRNARTRLWLRPYQVVSTAADAGLIEVVSDAVSLHHLREKWAELKWPPAEQNLHAYFVKAYGPEHLAPFKAAQRNFIESMAAYAVVCYLLKVKDRNDGNLLITRDGHMVHIDFGFMLSNTPGDMAFEQAPFKLTSELVDVMGGKDSASFSYFRELCVQGFLEARKPEYSQRVLLIVEMMSSGLGGQLHLPCVANQTTASLVSSIKDLYMLRLSDEHVRSMVDSLIDQSIDNWYTRQYDNYQSLQNAVKNIFFW